MGLVVCGGVAVLLPRKVAVLLPGFTINWFQNQVTRKSHLQHPSLGVDKEWIIRIVISWAYFLQDPYLQLPTYVFQCIYFSLVAVQFICTLWPDLKAIDGVSKSVTDDDDERKPLMDEKVKANDDVEPGLVSTQM